MTKAQKAEQAEAVTKLREWLKLGDTVYTILRHVSRSGMLREIGIVLLQADGSRTVDLHPNYLVAKALGERIGKRDGIVVEGCGMDMGFHLVYNLGRVLWPDGFGCVGASCRSNDHSNGDRDRTEHCQWCAEKEQPGSTSHHEHKGGKVHWHEDGGYALVQRWL